MAGLLVLAETDGSAILPSTATAATFAQQWARLAGGVFDLLVTGGPGIAAAAESWRGFGANRVLVAESPELAHPSADRVAKVCADTARSTGANSVAGPSSTFGRDILPRTAAILDLPMLSDLIELESAEGGEAGLSFRRPMYAGNIIATVRIPGGRGVFSIRTTAFGAPAPSADRSPVESIPVDLSALPGGTRWIALESGDQKRPELTSARVVVSGGRPLKDAETFERVLGGLADRLGGAVGATRAAVDSGIAPNELQVGQTGKAVAPDLYIAAGVSGSVQHLAGMKDSKVIVAINIDPDAPIFDVADYGLVADLFQAVPEMTAKV